MCGVQGAGLLQVLLLSWFICYAVFVSFFCVKLKCSSPLGLLWLVGAGTVEGGQKTDTAKSKMPPLACRLVDDIVGTAPGPVGDKAAVSHCHWVR